jgi:hypothetical protein
VIDGTKRGDAYAFVMRDAMARKSEFLRQIRNHFDVESVFIVGSYGSKAGAWDFTSFTFAPDQIVVNQGDKFMLHFIDEQGIHHIITVDGVGPLV